MSSASTMVCLLGAALLGQADDKVVHRAPSIEVATHRPFDRGQNDPDARANRLLYFGVHWGFNYFPPKNEGDRGNPDKDLSRLPTTYFHPKGPLGVALQKFNWFPGSSNTFHADARMVASLVGLGGQPSSQFAALWSEPPIAALGLNIGTEAAYLRPYQTLHYFEANPDLIALVQPPKGKEAFFTFITDAQKRGTAVKVFEGEHRATFEKTGGEKFYHLIVIELIKGHRHEHLHDDLLTKEAMQMLMGKTVEMGVLCFHTSHRYLKVHELVASVAKDNGYAFLEGLDHGDWSDERGHFTSQWVVVARKREYLKHLKEPDGYKRAFGNEPYWGEPPTSDRFVWKDGEKNSPAGLWRGDPYIADLRSLVHMGQFRLERLGFSRRLTSTVAQPLEKVLEGFDHVIVDARNR
jgi:hypothetical protein